MKAIVDYKIYTIPTMDDPTKEEMVGLYMLMVDGDFKYASQHYDNVINYAKSEGINDIIIL